MKVYIIAVMGMDDMVARHDPDGSVRSKKIPFECNYDTLAEFDAALKRGPVVGSHIVYDQIPDTYKCIIRKRKALRLTFDNCGAIRESQIEYLEAGSAEAELAQRDARGAAA